jgi:alpha-tubulin suppressor-like RCC1 family protein
LGLGDTTNRLSPTVVPVVGIVDISAGDCHTLLLTNTSVVLAFGNNANGQLGFGDMTHRLSPVLLPGLNNVVKIQAGSFVSFITTGAGQLFSIGSNSVISFFL